jgi:hypothetical protein
MKISFWENPNEPGGSCIGLTSNEPESTLDEQILSPEKPVDSKEALNPYPISKRGRV